MTDQRPAPIDDQHYVARRGVDWEQRLIGDGQAISAPRFMDFSGPRVPIEPDGEPLMALPLGFLSVFHKHTNCLWTVIYDTAAGPYIDENEVGCHIARQLYLRRFTGEPTNGQ